MAAWKWFSSSLSKKESLLKRRLSIALVTVALATTGLIGTAAPANASCTVVSEGSGCIESIPCRLAAKFGITLNCIH